MTTTYREVLVQRFGGVLKKGKHKKDGEACALELACALWVVAVEESADA